MGDQQHILFSIKDHIASLTLNRPDTFNAINEDMHRELVEILLSIRGNHDIRVVLLAAKGKAFSAGGDLNKIQTLHDDADKRNRMLDIGIRLIEALNQLAKARANEVFPLGMAYESLSIGSDDVLEALAGFQEKRKPEFKGY